MSYKVKFIILFVLFGTIVVSTSTVIAYNNIKKNMISDFNENVKNIASLKQNLFTNTINNKINIIDSISRDRRVLTFFQNSEKMDNLENISRNILKNNQDFFDITFINKKNSVVKTYSRKPLETKNKKPQTYNLNQENVYLSTLEFFDNKYLFSIIKKVSVNKKDLGYIKLRVDLNSLFPLFEKTSVANLYMVNQEENFIIYNDTPNLDNKLTLEAEFGEEAEDLSFADIYVGPNLYSQKIVINNGAEYRLILKLNNALIEEKQGKVFYMYMLLLLGVIVVSIPIAYLFSIIPDRLNQKLHDLNASLERRVKEEVEANRAKDQIMFQQSKNAAMGEMISMITHQWRQPLSSIGALASQVKLMSDLKKLEEGQTKELMNKVLDSTKYLSSTIEDFKNFFKPNKKREVVKISTIIDEVLKFSDHAISIQSIEIIREEDKELEAQIVKNEAIQVVMNLVKNAVDQLREVDYKRVITIKTYVEDEKKILEVIDNAGGIPESVLPNLFQEYYSTKKDGTGLGLYMSRMIVQNSLQGELTAFNEEETQFLELLFNFKTVTCYSFNTLFREFFPKIFY